MKWKFTTFQADESCGRDKTKDSVRFVACCSQMIKKKCPARVKLFSEYLVLVFSGKIIFSHLINLSILCVYTFSILHCVCVSMCAKHWLNLCQNRYLTRYFSGNLVNNVIYTTTTGAEQIEWSMYYSNSNIINQKSGKKREKYCCRPDFSWWCQAHWVDLLLGRQFDGVNVNGNEQEKCC